MNAFPTPPPAQEDVASGMPSGGAGRPVSRRAFAGGAAVMSGLSLAGGSTPAGASGRIHDAFGSVSTAPRLPAGFRRTFRSHFLRAGGIRQHAVIGGDGPPLLLVHGWPQNWYAWRYLMPQLARHFTVIAVDQRGIGLTEKPRDGYDSATLARDLVALMDVLGHERFAVVGHDTGYIIGYALAADHRDRVDRLVVAEIPGPPGVGDQPPLFGPDALNNRVWHIPFNRVDDELIVDMVRGNENAFYRYEFRIQSGGIPLPEHAIRYYVRLYSRSRHVLRASFGLYRAWGTTFTQNMRRAELPLTIPVLGIGGAKSWAERPGDGMKPAAKNVRTLVIPHAGHWVAEQAPEAMLEALDAFLAPYRSATRARSVQ
jgi:pimeloyl-ACP methyl ester carboxylesterase